MGLGKQKGPELTFQEGPPDSCPLLGGMREELQLSCIPKRLQQLADRNKYSPRTLTLRQDGKSTHKDVKYQKPNGITSIFYPAKGQQSITGDRPPPCSIIMRFKPQELRRENKLILWGWGREKVGRPELSELKPGINEISKNGVR